MNKDAISTSQLTTLVISYTLGSSLVLSSSNAVVRSGWVVVLLGTLEGLLIAWLYMALAERFQHRSLVQMTQQVFGQVLGAVPALLFIWFMLQLGGLVLGNFGDYFEITVLQRTPTAWFEIPLALAAVYAVRRGIGTLARTATIVLPITVFLVVMTSALLVPKMTTGNIFPLIDVGLGELLLGAHGSGMFPFGEAVVFLMVLPHLPRRSNARRPVQTGLLLAGLLLTLGTFRNIAVLGAAVKNTVFPSFVATRLIEVGEVITRVELLSAINFLTMGFVKVAVLIYGSTSGLAQVFGLKSHQPLVLPVGLLMVVLANSGFEHGFAENVVFITDAWPYYAPLFVIGLPLLLWVGALVRRQPREEKK